MRYIKKIPNLVAYYPLNETSGTFAINYAPANLNKLNGNNTAGTIAQPGFIGRGYAFDGASSVVDLGTSSSLVIGTQSFTWGGIFYVENSITTKVPLSSRTSSTGAGYEVILQNGGLAGNVAIRLGDTAGNGTFTANTVVGTNSFHFINGYVNAGGTQLGMSINGSINGTASYSGLTGTLNNSQNPSIGKRAALFYNKTAQHVYMVNRTLSANEFLRLGKLSTL